jgi:hypothetical protein
MKLTKDILTKAMANANIPVATVKVMYNWDNPTQLSTTEYNSAVSQHSMLFNNYIDGEDHFFDPTTMMKLLTESLPGLSVGSTNNALTNTGQGTFSGTDLIRISKEVTYESWSVVINFETASCSSDPTKKVILLNSTGSTSASGFNLGINGSKNLFYEFYDVNGVLRNYTIIDSLEEKSVVAVCKSNDLNSISIYVYNPFNPKETKKISFITEGAQLGSKWCIGGESPIPSASDLNQMFVGKINEFLLFSDYISEDQVKEISDSLFLTNITEEGYQTITQSYYPVTSKTTQQIQVGTETTGYTDQSTTITDESGATITLYEKVPVTSPVYETQVIYTQSTNASTRDVQELVAASKTYDYTYLSGYAPTCFLLASPESSATYEMYSSNKYTKNITKKAELVEGSGVFLLDEDYDNQKLVLVYLNGKLQEEGVDYTRDGININKYTGLVTTTTTTSSVTTTIGPTTTTTPVPLIYSQGDIMTYDVIDNGQVTFSDFAGQGSGTNITGEAGKDIYIDGIKMVYGQDYQDSGGDINLLQTLSAGRRALVTRHADQHTKTYGAIDSYICGAGMGPLISEQLWINGLRKLRDTEYSLNNICDLANSDTIISKKSVVIYENNDSYFNI